MTRDASISRAAPKTGTPLPLDALLERVPDAVVVTDAEGRMLMVNPAFLDLSRLVSAESACGRSLGDWVGRRESDLSMILAVLKSRGSVRGLSSAIRDAPGREIQIELSAALVPGTDGNLIGFIMRGSLRRETADADTAADLGAAVQCMTDRVGSVSLPELVRDTTDLVERHFIQAALELTGGNRTTAADVLGLSRQSLYVKLRRHRLQNCAATEPAAPAGCGSTVG